MLLTTFKVSVIDLAALRFLAHDKQMTASEYLRAVNPGPFRRPAHRRVGRNRQRTTHHRQQRPRFSVVRW